MSTHKQEWMTPKEVSKEFGFSIAVLCKYREQNINLPYFKHGQFIKYKRTDVETFMQSNMVNVGGTANV